MNDNEQQDTTGYGGGGAGSIMAVGPHSVGSLASPGATQTPSTLNTLSSSSTAGITTGTTPDQTTPPNADGSCPKGYHKVTTVSRHNLLNLVQVCVADSTSAESDQPFNPGHELNSTLMQELKCLIGQHFDPVLGRCVAR